MIININTQIWLTFTNNEQFCEKRRNEIYVCQWDLIQLLLH